MPEERFLATDDDDEDEGMELDRRVPGVDDNDAEEGRDGVPAENARGGRRADPLAADAAPFDPRGLNCGGSILPPLPLARTAAGSYPSRLGIC